VASLPLPAVRRITLIVMLAVLAVAVLAIGGYSVAGSGDGGDDATADTSGAARTPDALRTAVWERSYSECSSYDLQRIAAKYRGDPEEGAVATAVGRSWTEQLGAFDDAVASGRDGCVQAFRQKSG
jgi:hypothetical protein